MPKNQKINVKIKDVTNLGAGVAEWDNHTVFVKYGVTGDVCDCTVIKETKNYSVAKIDSIKEFSPYRKNSDIFDCDTYKSCGGCVFRHIDYEYEKQIKKNFVISCFKKIAGIEVIPENIETYSQDNYRNNARFPIGEKNGKPFPGFYSEKSHKIVEINSCAVQKNSINKAIKNVFSVLAKYNFSVYNEISGKGYLRHACLRTNVENEVALCIVINGKITDELKKFATEIVSSDFGIISVHANINKEKTNVIFGNETILLSGRDYLTETICNKKFNISPRSFFQVNTESAEMLFTKAKEYLNMKIGSVLLDLYCGAGTVGICLSDESTKLFGCEIIPEAIENANDNAKLNNIRDYKFFCGDASEGVKLCRETYGKIDYLVVDPPRKGLSSEAIESIIDSNTEQFVYISCAPDTLARDVKIFSTYGFHIEKMTLFDLFPRTSHVETVVLLTKHT